MPFADILDYAQFTAYIDPDALVEAQDNAIDILEVYLRALNPMPSPTTGPCPRLTLAPRYLAMTTR